MDKTVEFDIGSVATPVVGGGFVDVTFFISFLNGKYSEKEDDEKILVRLKYSGGFRFIGAMKTAIQTLIDNDEYSVDFKVLEKGEDDFNGKINLRGGIGSKSSRTENEVSLIDIYSEFDNSADDEINILNTLPETTVKVPTVERFETFESFFDRDTNTPPVFSFTTEDGQFPQTTLFNGANGEPWKTSSGSTTLQTYIQDRQFASAPDKTTWKILSATYSDGAVYSAGGDNVFMVFTARLTFVLAREVINVPYIADSVTTPSGGWTFSADIFINGIKYAKFARTIQQSDSWLRSGTFQFPAGIYTFMTDPIVVENATYTNTGIDISGSSTVDYDRGRSMFDVIESMVNIIDSSILFDKTGNLPVNGIGGDSFNYMKTFEDSNGDKTLLNLHIMQLTDAVPFDDNGTLVQKSAQATRAMLSFNRLMGLFALRFKIFWKLETRGDGIYFIIKHISEINFSVGLPDIYNTITYKNGNWSDVDFLEYNDENKFYSAFFKDSLANNVDFIQQTITFPKLKDIFTTPEQIKLTRFYFDTWHSQQNIADYPASGNDSFMIFSCDMSTFVGNFLTDTRTDIGFDSVTGSHVDFVIIDPNSPVNAFVEVTGAELQLLDPGDTFSLIIGYTVNTLPDPGISLHVFIDGIGDTDYGDLSIGANDLSFRIPDNWTPDKTIRIRFIASQGSNVNVRIQTFIKKRDNLCFKSSGKISGEASANASLSIANIIEDHWLWDVPSDVVIANNNTLNLDSDRLQKDKTFAFIYPLYKSGVIDFNKLMVTSKGDLQIKEIEYSMDGAFAKITGVLV